MEGLQRERWERRAMQIQVECIASTCRRERGGEGGGERARVCHSDPPKLAREGPATTAAAVRRHHSSNSKAERVGEGKRA